MTPREIEILQNLDDLEALEVNEPLLSKLKKADDDEKVQITIAMHAINWKRLMAIRYYYYRKKGDNRARSAAGILFTMIDRVYQGMINSAKRKEVKEEEPPVPDEDEEGQEEIEYVEPSSFHVHRARKI